MPELVESRFLTEGGFRVGARSQAIVEAHGSRFTMTSQVIAAETNKHVTVDVSLRGFWLATTTAWRRLAAGRGLSTP